MSVPVWWYPNRQKLLSFKADLRYQTLNWNPPEEWAELRVSPSSGWRHRSRKAQGGLFTSCRIDKNTRVFFTSAVVHNSTSRLPYQEDRVHFSASSNVGSEWVSSSLNFIFSLQEKKFSWNTPYSHLPYVYVAFFIQLVWFSSVSHTSHNLLLSTESFPFFCESLSNLLCLTYYFLLLLKGQCHDVQWFFCAFFLRDQAMAIARANVVGTGPWQLGQPRKQLHRPGWVEQISFSAALPCGRHYFSPH